MILRGKQNIIPLLAMTVLIIGSLSTLYVHANQAPQSTNLETIRINNQSVEIQTLFDTFSNTTIETDDGEKTGILLSDILLSKNLECPTCSSYIIKASDGYQQTVNWDDIQQGILTMEKRTYFPHLAHAFWVRNIVQIEVKE
ncbi:MAG TPA: hypothetical protein VKP59_05850 [Candidatus Thermoplasmatota archaeon]|nr:hypothetical protein [Candidatus Thermoplasmatota archaeon]